MAKVEWRGLGGHFLCADRCCFRLHCVVNGKYRVSTVGCYHHSPDSRDWSSDNWQSLRGLGPGETKDTYRYETMVFEEEDGKVLDYGEELDCEFASTAEGAQRNHMRLVAKCLERDA